MIPDFFIIGAPKCGTTALAAYLSQHASVFVSEPKEPNYFNVDLNLNDYDAAGYEALFSGAPGDLLFGEASVWYLYSEVAVPRILEARSDARFIVMLRNPVDLVVSLHRQMLFSGYDDIEDFWSAWEIQTDRIRGSNVPVGCPDAKLLAYRSTCALGTQLERCLEAIERDRLLVVVFDDFKSDPRREWQRVQTFLGIADDGRVTFPVVNPASVRRWKRLKRVSDWYARTRKKIGFGGFGSGVLNRLDELNETIEPAPELTPEQRAALADVFSAEIAKLERLLNRDFSHWR